MPAYDAELFSPPAPLAHVTLRHLKTGVAVHDVPMLIDCGADATLIPKTCATQLGVSLDADRIYELTGFDGTSSVARSVQLDLLFPNGTFEGRFMLIDQAWGVLGRNILNHVALLLDGPKRTWIEFSH